MNPNTPSRIHLLDQSKPRKARAFTAAEKSLIAKVHGFMPEAQLLAILNERLLADLGPDAEKYSPDQLRAEIGTHGAATPEGGHDWASIRKMLAHARKAGTIALVTDQVIDDFAIVYSLSPRQVVRLKDILLARDPDEEESP